MNPVSSDAAVAMVVKAQEQMKQDGQNAVKLIEDANIKNPRPLPTDATFSTRV